MDPIVLNKPKPPPETADRPAVIDRRGLEHADRSLRAIGFMLRLFVVVGVIVGILTSAITSGKSLLALILLFIPWLLAEALVIAARACVATAWAARKPDA